MRIGGLVAKVCMCVCRLDVRPRPHLDSDSEDARLVTSLSDRHISEVEHFVELPDSFSV
jgi:hypothetical protein